MLYYKTYLHPSSPEWVIFIHGAGGSSSIWFKQIKDFSLNFNVLMVDLRGHGKSQGNKAYEQYTFKEICQDVIDVMDHARIKTAHFVGISLGTILIRNLYEMAPERVKSMILGGAIMRLNLRAKVLSAFGDWFKTVMPYLWLYSFFAWIIMPKKRHRQSRLLFVNEARKLCQKEFIYWYRLIYEVNPLLKYFSEKPSLVPTLYMMGDEDHMFLPFIRKLVIQQPHSKLFVVENSGHVCNVDQSDIFNQQSIGFIFESSLVSPVSPVSPTS
jgi:pimeloyl-ACP methyl ester carboxylesterase